MNTTFAVSPFDRHRLPALRVTLSDLVEIAAPLLGRADTIQYWYFETGNPHRFVGVESTTTCCSHLLGRHVRHQPWTAARLRCHPNLLANGVITGLIHLHKRTATSGNRGQVAQN